MGRKKKEPLGSSLESQLIIEQRCNEFPLTDSELFLMVMAFRNVAKEEKMFLGKKFKYKRFFDSYLECMFNFSSSERLEYEQLWQIEEKKAEDAQWYEPKDF